MDRTLYTYFRSSASYRVRIALNLKGLVAKHVPVHLNRNGGEQFQSEFRAVNPQALVPVFTEGELVLTQSLAILKYLAGPLQVPEEGKSTWVQHWIGLGLEAIETEIHRTYQPGHFCVGATPTIADCCLVPQLFNARRFGVDLAPYPTLLAIDEACQRLSAFVKAHPDRQPDAE
jgi:maleylpyruvate isomerase